MQATHEGLTSAEVEKRIAEFGQNKLPESGRNSFFVFLSYMWNPLSWAMEIAAIIAICINDWADFALIVGLLLINSTISYVEESNADKAIKARQLHPLAMHAVCHQSPDACAALMRCWHETVGRFWLCAAESALLLHLEGMHTMQWWMCLLPA